MDHVDVKRLFFEHFSSLKHKKLPDVPLIPPEHDTSSLFINSGMQPLKPLFMGLQKPPASRLYNSQKCVRTGDIDDVGDNKHLTFFFMLGNWSIGDYGVTEAAQFAYDLLVKKYGMNKNKLWATVFKGDKKLGLGRDDNMFAAWQKIGIPRERIFLADAEEVFWVSGKTGPCGPTSEMHYDFGASKGCGKKSCNPTCDCGRFMEIWNPCVQISYNRNAAGKLTSLKLKSIDAGAGFERIVGVLQGTNDVFTTTIFKPLIQQIEKLSSKNYTHNKKAMRIVADHVRASTFIAGEGVTPARKDQGYVLRRIIRRMVRYSKQLGIDRSGIKQLVRFVIDDFKKEYPYLQRNSKQIAGIIGNEYDNFNKTLEKGSRLLAQLMQTTKGKTLRGVDVFHLYDTYGFPMELTRELAAEKGFKIDENGYEREFAKHREVSKKGQSKKFVSGLADHSEMVIKYHTVNHMLLSALQKVLGPKVTQKGSNLTAERLRFDFNWGEKMTPEQLKKSEDIVNKWIKQDVPVTMEEMSVADAKKAGAQGVFTHKYGAKVKVYTIKGISKEICLGPHVNKTGVLGQFKIVKEKSSSAGVRRIKAVLE
ncbi:alanine--tRNA ligase [Candidatus Woesearchaeota archaeon]|jgi:alanyl-tRNA synthetase|nr:alanine--tRNA ligase [Candidatus Woesearchaeota archaeon]MBT4114365.1 alanine--tRNA ligase [Candidatus Woesearchaeota archaeon]MBT4248570.1 alanine--tRNA ligase [Candidatus Woesearchaeota archaeon]